MTEPADVFVRVGLVRSELEILRRELGRPIYTRGDISFSNAAPREVLFEALALFRKADRLCFERTGEQAILPQPPSADRVQPADVMAVVDQALGRLERVNEQLGAEEHGVAPPRDAGKAPSDVLNSIFLANRQLNVLLDQPFTPNDVYLVVSLSVGYAARICTRIPAWPAAGLPPFERRKRPGDVYTRLWNCLSALRGVFIGSGLDMLELGRLPYATEQIAPSDVYDLASLLVAELAYLHCLIRKLEPPAASDFNEAGRRIPSHVYQLAGVLEQQINAMGDAVKADRHVFVG